MINDREQMVIYKFKHGGYAVRPLNWTAIVDEDGALAGGANFTAVFQSEDEAKEYCELCNDPLGFAAKTLRDELLKHGKVWDGFLACIENSLKECVLPFAPESEIAERVLEQMIGDDTESIEKNEKGCEGK